MAFWGISAGAPCDGRDCPAHESSATPGLTSGLAESPLYDVQPEQNHHSAERYANALVLAPYNIAGIDFLLWKDDECELIRYPALRSDFERGSRVGDITNNAADRYVADPDQTHVKNRPTPS
jgi:hypothetical protein